VSDPIALYAFDLLHLDGKDLRHWDLFVKGYGPTRTTAAGCDPESRAGLERDFIAYMEKFLGEAGLAMQHEYLVTIRKRS
jgi:hypothetical protein